MTFVLDVTTDVPVVASMGNLTLATPIRPLGCDTPEKWYLHIWRELSADVWRACKLAIDSDADYSDLTELEAFVNNVVEVLESAYGLED